MINQRNLSIDRVPLLDATHAPLTRRERVATILRAVLIAPVAIAALWLWAVLMLSGCDASENPCATACAHHCAARDQLVERFDGCGEAGCQCEEEMR